MTGQLTGLKSAGVTVKLPYHLYLINKININAMGSSRHDMDMVNPYLHPMVLTSSGGHRKVYGWQAGGTHPTGMLSCMGNVLVICAPWLAFYLFFHEFCLHFK